MRNFMVHRLVVPPLILLILLSSSLALVALQRMWRERSYSDLRSIIVVFTMWITAREDYTSSPSSTLSDSKILGIYNLPR